MVVPLENAVASVWSVIAKHIQEEPDFKVHAQGPPALSSPFWSAASSRKLLATHLTLFNGSTLLPFSLSIACKQDVSGMVGLLMPCSLLHCPAACHGAVL